MKEDIIIISLGGSLIVPENIDVNFLKRFRNLILKYIKGGKRFVIMCGGGRTARNYQDAAKRIVKLTREDVDWLGIHATRINAHLLRTIFYKEANPKIVTNPRKRLNFKEKVLIASGWVPGCSTDYDAVLIAENLKIKKLVNLSNVDYVYDKDPRKFKDAKLIKEIKWREFRKLLPKEWDPGLNVPFDPVASRKAERLKLEVVIMNGKKLENLENYLEGREFKGSRVN